MNIKKLLSAKLLAACGIGLALLTSSASSQEPASAPKDPNSPASAGNRASAPRAAVRPAGVSSTSSNANSVQTTAYPVQSYRQTFIPAGVPGYGSPAEMMVYQNEEWKVVTENLNDPKTMEAQREGSIKIAEAMQTLRSDSSSDEKRTEAKKVVTKYLQAHFDHDQKKRREQVENLEAQIVKLKSQLEKRSQSKDQMIELRLTLLENDASGLAFPQSWTQLPGAEPNTGSYSTSLLDRYTVPTQGGYYSGPSGGDFPTGSLPPQIMPNQNAPAIVPSPPTYPIQTRNTGR